MSHRVSETFDDGIGNYLWRLVNFKSFSDKTDRVLSNIGFVD